MRILLVEDEELVAVGIQSCLENIGYTIDWIDNGKIAYQQLTLKPKADEFDCIILDLGLPGMGGLELLKKLRASGDKTKVLILTARDSNDDCVTGLDSGADDYLTKPFDNDVLCARLRALQRRDLDVADSTLVYGDIRLDLNSHHIEFKNEAINLPRREFALLKKLLENIGRVVTRGQLTETLYGWNDDVESNTLEVHVHNLRKKFGTQLIQTVRGIGYTIKKQKS